MNIFSDLISFSEAPAFLWVAPATFITFDRTCRLSLSPSGHAAAGLQEPCDFRERADYGLAGQCRLTVLIPQQHRRLGGARLRRRNAQQDRGIGEIVQAKGNRFHRRCKRLEVGKAICLAGVTDDVACLFGDRLPAVYEVVT